MVLPAAEGRGEGDQGPRRLLEGRRGPTVTDALYAARAVELARRALGDTAPNPPVGAVLVRDGTTLGEGLHHVRGGPHAEVGALADAARRGHDVRGATAFVSLEPCDHHGLTPPCSLALLRAGVARVVIGTRDPNPRTAGGGIARLVAAGTDVVVRDDPEARELIEVFATTILRRRPYLRLKLAASLDGYLAPERTRYALTGDVANRYVRESRVALDGVLVGAGTLRVDDPALTVRPPRARRRPYHRVVICGAVPPDRGRRLFLAAPGYAPPTLVVPEAHAGAFAPLADRATILPARAVATGAGTRIDLGDALERLGEHGITSLLCEGGALLGASLLAAGLVDRLDWLVAPRLLASESSLAALSGARLVDLPKLAFDRVIPLGEDVLLSARMEAPCSAV